MEKEQAREDLRVEAPGGQVPPDEKLPNLHTLRYRFLDQRRHNTPGPLLDCVAHMLLYVDQPDRLLEIGIGYLVRTLAACRGDAGVSTPGHSSYIPTAVYLDPRRAAPTMLGVHIPNRHPSLQLIWHTNGPVPLEDVEQNPLIEDLREAFMTLRSRSMVARRLEHHDAMLGLVCLDHTEESHVWRPNELALIDDFCREYLAPLLAYSLSHAKRLSPTKETAVLTAAEREVVRLAATGLTYSEIAAALNKSVRTVDNQLRSAREKLGARNQTDLVRLSTPFL